MTGPRRKACGCGPHVKVQGYQNQVTVPIPPHMASYREAREREGLRPYISVDRCILGELVTLWRAGIRTSGSCCGHNQLPSMINGMTSEDGAAMEALGYERWPAKNANWAYTYYAKSIPGRFK